jgi:hypothetical protein
MSEMDKLSVTLIVTSMLDNSRIVAERIVSSNPEVARSARVEMLIETMHATSCPRDIRTIRPNPKP